jgi:hypothetical protein
MATARGLAGMSTLSGWHLVNSFWKKYVDRVLVKTQMRKSRRKQ